MAGQPPLELDLALLPRAAIVSDIVYAPLETALLRQAGARGNATLAGLGMLLHQARPAVEACFGVPPKVTTHPLYFVAQDPGRSTSSQVPESGLTLRKTQLETIMHCKYESDKRLKREPQEI